MMDKRQAKHSNKQSKKTIIANLDDIPPKREKTHVLSKCRVLPHKFSFFVRKYIYAFCSILFRPSNILFAKQGKRREEIITTKGTWMKSLCFQTV
jgi:hypothetical protein